MFPRVIKTNVHSIQTLIQIACKKDSLISDSFPSPDAKNPNFGNNTLVGVCVGLEPVNGWSASVICSSDKDVTLTVSSHTVRREGAETDLNYHVRLVGDSEREN